MGFPRGMDHAREINERQNARDNRLKMFNLWLKDGEQATFWFIDGEEEIGWPLMHQYEKLKNNGEKYQVDVLCSRDSYDDSPEDCPICVEQGKNPFTRGIARVYVESIVGPYAAPAWFKGEVEQRRRGGTVVYRQVVNQVWILQIKSRLRTQLYNFCDGLSGGDPFEDENVTIERVSILPRRFMLGKSGSGTQSQEILTAKEIEPVPDEIVSLRVDKMDIGDLVESLYGQERWLGKPKAVTHASGRGLPSSDSYGKDDDDDDDDDFIQI